MLHWHSDTFDLPSGATRLAETAITPNQAFAYGPKVLALQFHAEVDPRGMERWLIGHAGELARAGIDVVQLRADTARYGPVIHQAGIKMFEDWLDRLVTFDLRSPAEPLARSGRGQAHRLTERGCGARPKAGAGLGLCGATKVSPSCRRQVGALGGSRCRRPWRSTRSSRS